MNDRGDTIITLARELLRDNELGQSIEPAAKPQISFRVLCFTAMLAAAGSSVVTDYIIDARRPLNRYEKVELDALIFYAARMKNIDEAGLRHQIESRVGKQDFADFTKRDYRMAQAYLRGEIQ